MDRRQFLKYSAAGVAGIAAGTADLTWFASIASAAGATGRPWKFGIMADTQWKANKDGENPGTCAVGIIRELNRQFIMHGVEFVIQVGDLVDVENDALNGNPSRRTLPIRAEHCLPLYEAGIGFFPLRGNHEGSQLAAIEFRNLWPQTRGLGPNVGKATEFSSPFAKLEGLSYSFDWENVRFVMLDQFRRLDNTGSTTNNNMLDQVAWIDERLTYREPGTHALVLSHKNVIGQNHTDVLFGANPASNPVQTAAFIESCARNRVGYQIGGHDHMHNRSMIKTPNPDSDAYVNQLICSSNSYKFYNPTRPSRDETYNYPRREKNVAQELFTIGYYIVTVDGPRMTIDYYASTHGLDYDDYDLVATPKNMLFYKRERFGYSLNGTETLVGPGESYAGIGGTFGGTTAQILAGTNSCTVTDRSLRPLVKNVNTGWAAPAPDDAAAASNIFTLWNMAHNLSLWDPALVGLLPDSDRTDETDVYVLAMTYFEDRAWSLGNGRFGIATRTASGEWVNAVDMIYGDAPKRFVRGPWGPDYDLGTYGVDPATNTAWAVIDYTGEFMVRRGIDINRGQRRRREVQFIKGERFGLDSEPTLRFERSDADFAPLADAEEID